MGGRESPKLELHCHLEGTIAPERASKMAARRGVDLSSMITPDGHYIWTDFSSFLALYDQVSDLISSPQDYYDLTLDHLVRAAEQGVVYTEFFISADHARRIGLDYGDMVAAIDEAARHAEERTGHVCRLISTCIRHFGPEAARDVARETVRHAHPRVTGFGMGGDERQYHPSDFVPAFETAYDAGLGCTVHAGEFGGPESVCAALDHLPVKRIGHGVRAVEDPDLLHRIRDEDVVLELCPGSNISLGLYPSLSHHPLPALLAAGVRVTVSSDDPPFFHTDMALEYASLSGVFGLSPGQVKTLGEVAIEAAFLEDAAKENLRQLYAD